MKCPHCLENFHEDINEAFIAQDADFNWNYCHTICPACRKIVVHLLRRKKVGNGVIGLTQVYPKNSARVALSDDVPIAYASDYKEAASVFSDSPKASAALSRRCLQNLLREKARVKKSNLNDEIEEVLESKQLPSHLSESLHAVRAVGNFAAHPIKSQHTGEVVDVEPGEAEWLLDVLEGLFDFYFVQPALTKKRKENLNKKLESSGKSALK